MGVILSDQAWQDLKRDHEKLRGMVHRLAGGGGINRHESRQPPDPRKVRFRNDYAGTIPAFGVLRVTGATLVAGVKVLTVDRPDSSFARLYLVNGPTPVAEAEDDEEHYGWGTFLWHADWVLYDDADTPAFGESWGPQNASFKLKKWRYGFTIWGEHTGEDTDKVLASQQWVNHFYGQTDAAINKGSSGTVSVYDGNNADTSINVSSVENKFANVAITKKVSVTWEAGKWRLTSAEC